MCEHFAYSKKYSCEVSPYEDWVARGKMDAVFQRWSEGCDWTFMPGDGLFCLNVNIEDVEAQLVGVIEVDDVAATVRITRLSLNAMDYAVSHKPIFGSMEEWIEIESTWPEKNLILSEFVSRMFGSHWQLNRESCVEDVDDELYQKIIDICFEMKPENGPYGIVIGLFDERRKNAAVIIQALYRGWKARMEHRFDPKTCLGRWLIMKEYRTVVSSI